MDRLRQLVELKQRFEKDFDSALINLDNREQLIVTSFFKTVIPIFREHSEGYYDRCYSIYEKEILEQLRNKARPIHNFRLMDYLVQDSMKLVHLQHDFNVNDDDQCLSEEEFDDFLSNVLRLISLRHEMLLLHGTNVHNAPSLSTKKSGINSLAKHKVETLGDHEEYMTIAECAKFLGRSKVTIHEYKKQGLPCYKIGRTVKFKKSEVLNFMRQQEKKSKRK